MTKGISNGARGFTVVELITVAAITLILSGIILVNFRAGQGNLALDRSAHQLAQDIRKATGLALGAEQINYCSGNAASFDTISGYGLYFDVNDEPYILYANCTSDGGINNEGYRQTGPVDRRDKVVETIFLEEQVEILAIQADGSGEDDVAIAFFPPDPIVALCGTNGCGGSNSFSTATITLALKNDSSVTRTITINEKGVIDIN